MEDGKDPTPANTAGNALALETGSVMAEPGEIPGRRAVGFKIVEQPEDTRQRHSEVEKRRPSVSIALAQKLSFPCIAEPNHLINA